jgi:hypothetical protein
MSQEIKPSREMDALIASKVFGWLVRKLPVFNDPETGRVHSCTFCNNPHLGFTCSKAFNHREDYCTDWHRETNEEGCINSQPVPAYSTDIAETWFVVEEMKRRGWLIHIAMLSNGFVVNGTEYELPNGKWTGALLLGGSVQRCGDTAPEAICKAALAALGEINLPETQG